MWEQRYFNHSQFRSVDTAKLVSNKVLGELVEEPSASTLVVLGDKNKELTESINQLGIPFKSVLTIQNAIDGICHFFENPTNSIMIAGSFSHSISKADSDFNNDPMRYFDISLDLGDLSYLKNEHINLAETSDIVDKNKKPTLLSTQKKSALHLSHDFETQNKFLIKLKKISSQNVLSHFVAFLPFEQLKKYKLVQGVWDLSNMSIDAALEEFSQKINHEDVSNIYLKCKNIEFRLLLWKKFRSHKNVSFDYIDLIMETSMPSSLLKIASKDCSSLIVCLDEFPKISFIRVEQK